MPLELQNSEISLIDSQREFSKFFTFFTNLNSFICKFKLCHFLISLKVTRGVNLIIVIIPKAVCYFNLKPITYDQTVSMIIYICSYPLNRHSETPI